MKIILIYFTGTNNTQYLSNKIKSKLESENAIVDLLQVNKDTPFVDLSQYDLIGIGYPIHAFNSPLVFNNYLKKLNLLPQKKYFIYKNSGETFALNNSSSRIIKRRFKRKKMQLIGEYHYVMPYNIHFRFDDAFIKEILIMNNKLVDVMVYKLANNINNEIKSNWFYDFLAFIISIQKIGGPINSFFYKVDKKKCTNCKKCLYNCPVKNIYLKKSTIKFHHHCAMCMKCSFFCPNNAIKIGFLEKWKVNGVYNFAKIEKDKPLVIPYIDRKKSKGFYKCFPKTFTEIDNDYNFYIKKSN